MNKKRGRPRTTIYPKYSELQEYYNNGNSWRQVAKHFKINKSFIDRGIASGDLKSRNRLLPEDLSALQERYDSGYSWAEVAEFFGVSTTSLVRSVKSGKLKSRSKRDAAMIVCGEKNYNVIQEFYDSGYSQQETEERFGISFTNAVNQGFLKSRSRSEAFCLTLDLRKRPSRNWSDVKGRSYPEKLFLNALIKHSISGWVCEYRKGRYRYDFAWPEIQLDVEIDGSQHLRPDVRARDQKRDDFSSGCGWVVLRFTAKEVVNNIEGCIDKLQSLINLLRN